MSNIPSAKLTLSYPLYGADFDPRNSGFLLVGGGGGEGRSGVGNKITLLNTTKRKELSEVVDIDLSRDEDSVTSLAIAQAGDASIVVFAGINSSTKDQEAGKNEHLRSFRIGYPPIKDQGEKNEKATGQSQALSKQAFFQVPPTRKKETYQRVLRLSPWAEDQQQRVGAIASSLAVDNEIIIFRATTTPTKSDQIAAISLGKDEAADLAIRPADSDGNYVLAYCTDDEVYTYVFSNSSAPSPSEASLVYQLARPENAKRSKLTFRSLRFLTPRHLILLRNRPGRSGADLVVLQLGEAANLGAVVLEKYLRKSTKLATGLDVCVLSSSPSGERQFVIAVASQDLSIEVFTLEYSPSKGIGSFKTYAYFKNVHPASITSIRFSNFVPPPMPVTKDTRPQVIKLASTSVSQTVIVHTFPLRPHPPTKTKTPRYVLQPLGPSETLQTAFSAFMAILVIGIVAFFLQAFTEIRGGVPPTLGASEWLSQISPRLHDLMARPYMFSPDLPSAQTAVVKTVESTAHRLSDLLIPPNGDISTIANKAIVVRDTVNGLSADLHPDGHPDESAIEKENLKRFEDLHPVAQEGWKNRLKAAGHWAEEQGETILKGVFFSELGGLVGEAVRGA